MRAEEYINLVVGKPWESRAEGPDSFDCWGLVIDSFKKIDGVHLPQIKSYANIDSEKHVIADEAFGSNTYEKCNYQDGAIMTAFMGDKLVHVGDALRGAYCTQRKIFA